MGDDLEEYRKRLVPASDEEIIALAERMWADPKLRTIFARVEADGDLSDEESTEVSAAIAAYRQGELWDRDELHLKLAPCLLRHLAVGQLAQLDSVQAREFLADRKVAREGGVMLKPVKLTATEAIGFAKAVQNDPKTWEAIERLKDFPNCLPEEIDVDGVLARFESNYIAKYGFFNRSGFGPVIGLLRTIASGKTKSLDSPEALQALRHTQSIRDGDQS